jgi:hypothetical protein
MTSATQVKSHTVHVDVLMDAMRILFNNEITFQVEGINEDENTLLIKTSTNSKLIKHKKALENIKSLVADYAYYRHGSDSGKLDNIIGEDEN